MNPRTDYEALERSPNGRRLLSQEEFIVEVTEALVAAMDRSHTSRADLAKRLGKSKGFVSQILSGGRNLTLRTVADVAGALGCHMRVRLCRDERPGYMAPVPMDEADRVWPPPEWGGSDLIAPLQEGAL